jgi:hypothetical protein
VTCGLAVIATDLAYRLAAHERGAAYNMRAHRIYMTDEMKVLEGSGHDKQEQISLDQ